MNLKALIAGLREYALHLGIVLAIVLAGVLFGLQEGGPSSARKVEPERWRIPAVSAGSKSGPEGAAVAAAMFFDENPQKQGQDKAKAAADQAWHFVGTARAGDHIAALIVTAKAPHVMQLGPGAKLPNGEEIVAVDSGVLRYRDDAGPHELRAFAQPRPENKDKK